MPDASQALIISFQISPSGTLFNKSINSYHNNCSPAAVCIDRPFFTWIHRDICDSWAIQVGNGNGVVMATEWWLLRKSPYSDTRSAVVCYICKYKTWHAIGCRYSIVGIATRYKLEGPGIESLWGRDFPHPLRPALGPIQPPIHWVPRLSRG